MNAFRKRLLAVVAAATVGLGTIGSAHADAFASAVLDINNFRLLHASGAAYATADFRTLTGTNDAHATASLNGVFAADSRSLPILSGTQPDVPQQCVGAPCPPIGENNFTPFAAPPPVPGNFGYADQRLVGSSITINGTPAGARAQTRAQASTNTNMQTASGDSDVGSSTTFQFTLGESDTMTVSFDATPYAAAFISEEAGPTSNANARMSWAINIVDLTTGASVFQFAPADINGRAIVSRTDGDTGLPQYNRDMETFSFLATTPLLNAGTMYQITVQQSTLANALQQEEVPEPATLAIVAAGLLSMSLTLRRRQS